MSTMYLVRETPHYTETLACINNNWNEVIAAYRSLANPVELDVLDEAGNRLDFPPGLQAAVEEALDEYNAERR